MSRKKLKEDLVELTPLEKIELLYKELTDWYGEAEQKELRAAAKLLIVGLDKFATHGGSHWHHLAQEYLDILKNDPEKFEKIIESNRGELRGKKDSDVLH